MAESFLTTFMQGQLQEWTVHSHTDLGKFETSRDIKKSFENHLNISKSCINFQNLEGVAQTSCPFYFWSIIRDEVHLLQEHRVSRTLVSGHFLSISTCEIWYHDIQFSVTIESKNLSRQLISRHLYPKGIKTSVLDNCFPKPISQNHTQTPVSRHLFPKTISGHLFSDIRFPTPVSWNHFQTPVSQN